MARRKSTRRHHRTTRRRRRRNPSPRMFMRANPRRRRYTFRRRRRHVRRNPGITRSVKGLIPGVKRLAAGAVGVSATRLIPGYAASMFPQIPILGPAGMGVRAAAAVLAGFVGSKVMGRAFGEDMAFAGLSVVADEALRTYLYPVAGVPMEAYLDNGSGMGAFMPRGMGQYLSPGRVAPALPSARFEGRELGSSLGSEFTVSRLDANSRL